MNRSSDLLARIAERYGADTLEKHLEYLLGEVVILEKALKDKVAECESLKKELKKYE